jgi:hypothetical protein
MLPSFNVIGGELEECSNDPLTGWFRDGCCNTDRRDRGLHTVCCVVTEDFLEFARSQGNDAANRMQAPVPPVSIATSVSEPAS